MFEVYQDIPPNFVKKVNELFNNMDKLPTETGDDYKNRIDNLWNDLGEFSFDQKAIYMAMHKKNVDAEVEAVKNAIELMSARVKSLAKTSTKLESFLKSNVENSGLLDPIKSPYFNIRIRKNPPKLNIYNADAITDNYKLYETVVKFDNEKIKADLKDGFVVEGAKLESGTRLEIK
jgi:hypothetical protein